MADKVTRLFKSRQPLFHLGLTVKTKVIRLWVIELGGNGRVEEDLNAKLCWRLDLSLCRPVDVRLLHVWRKRGAQ